MSLYIQRVGNSMMIGYELFPNRKRPQLIVREDGEAKSYGIFKSEADAIGFMQKLADLTEARDAE